MLDLHFVLASASQNPQTGLRTQEAPPGGPQEAPQEAPRRANQEGRQEAPWEGPGRPPRRANIGQQEGARRPPRRARPKPPCPLGDIHALYFRP